MARFRKILCVVDDRAPESPALERAAWLAGACGAELDLLAIHYNDYMLGHPLYDKDKLEEARRKAVENVRGELEAIAERIGKEKGIRASAAAVWDHPEHEGILTYVPESGADLVLKDAQHHSALRVALLSNEDWQLIRGCPVPLWIVKRRELPETPRLIAAVDPVHRHDKPGALDEAILSLARDLSAALSAEFHAFHSFDPRIVASAEEHSAYVLAAESMSELQTEFREQHEELFEKVLEPYDLPEKRRHLVNGIPEEELPELAENLDALAVVMGAVARGALERLFIGSTAERTLNRLQSDLVIVKPPAVSNALATAAAEKK